MSATAEAWSYELSRDCYFRLPALLKPNSFEQIAASITATMHVLCCHRSAIKGTELRRPIYTVQVERHLFDLFFNSPAGYRAAYFRSPGFGVDANVLLMQLAASRLIAHSVSLGSKLPPDFLWESLVTTSAKVWLAECGKESDRTCIGCSGEWHAGETGSCEIRNGRWENSTDVRARRGTQAPYLSKIRFIGAFRNDQGSELIPYDKRFRAYDLHRFGWS
jgi:hypothetical protein